MSVISVATHVLDCLLDRQMGPDARNQLPLYDDFSSPLDQSDQGVAARSLPPRAFPLGAV